MALLNMLLSVSEPTGFWETIIKAFESGVGSYILAIVLITLVIRLIWAPFDTFNKKINKKNARIQAKLQPEIEKLKAKYGNDKNLLNQKTQELYKKNNFSMGGSCFFMLIFMALNLTIFFTLFSGLNAMADYKISQEYDYLKYNYANVLNVTNEVYEGKITDKARFTEFFENYNELKFKTETNEEGKFISALLNDKEIIKVKFKEEKDFVIYKDKVNETGEPVVDEEGNVVKEVDKTADQVIESLVTKFVTEQKQKDEEGNEIPNSDFKGSEVVAVVEEQDVTIKNAVDIYSASFIADCYKNNEEKPSFLWIENYWIADSPFKRSVFSFDDFKGEIGSQNVSEQEEIIYNAFMPNLDRDVGRVNGYLILAVLSIAVSFLSMFLTNLGNKKKGEKMPPQMGGKIMMFVLPIIMGVFAIFYNSVFAIYLVVSQAISAALTPIENLIINKWDAHDEKKQEEKAKTVVSYRRK